MRVLALSLVLFVAGAVLAESAADSPAAAVADTVAEVSLSPEEAVAALDSLGIDFTEDAFVDSAKDGNLEVVELFVQAGMSVNATNNYGETALYYAVGRSLEMVRYLVEQGASLTATDNYGYTPLHWAARRGHLETVQYLVGQGVSVTATDNDGYTPLHWAVFQGHPEVAAYLESVGG